MNYVKHRVLEWGEPFHNKDNQKSKNAADKRSLEKKVQTSEIECTVAVFH